MTTENFHTNTTRGHGAHAYVGHMTRLLLFRLAVVLVDSPMTHQRTGQHLRGRMGRVRRSETNVPLCPSLRLGEELRWLTFKVSVAAWFWPHWNAFVACDKIPKFALVIYCMRWWMISFQQTFDKENVSDPKSAEEEEDSEKYIPPNNVMNDCKWKTWIQDFQRLALHCWSQMSKKALTWL